VRSSTVWLKQFSSPVTVPFQSTGTNSLDVQRSSLEVGALFLGRRLNDL
jgi:hypothetical protein